MASKKCGVRHRLGKRSSGKHVFKKAFSDRHKSATPNEHDWCIYLMDSLAPNLEEQTVGEQPLERPQTTSRMITNSHRTLN